VKSFAAKENKPAPAKRNVHSAVHSIVQPRLKVGAPDDQYEQEADRVADRVVANQPVADISSVSGAPPTTQNLQSQMANEQREIQRQPEEEEEELAQPKLLQRQPEEEEEELAQPKLLQRQAEEEEEELQPKLLQRQPEEEEEELAQPKLLQRQEEEEEELQPKLLQRQEEEEEELQPKLLQRQPEEEELAQPKFLQRQEEEEEELQPKLLQRQGEEEEEEPVQAKLIQRQAEEEEEEPVQARLIQRFAEEEKDDEVQARGASPSTQAASRAINSQSSGSPIRPDVKSILESGMRTDLSSVRVHEDSASQEAAASIKAKAFTHKNNIWLGAGQSQSDLHLMAHESTHVVQQGQAGQITPAKATVQRLEDDSNSEGEGAAVGPVEKAIALAAARVAKQLAAAKAVKSKQQLGEEKLKKAEEDKVKESTNEEKKKAEQDIAGKESENEPGEEGAATEKGKAKGGAKGKGAARKAKIPGFDAAFKSVVAKSRKEAKAQKSHKPASVEADAAQQAAESPASEMESKAQSNQVDTMETAETPAFDAVAFKARLMERIEAIAPRSAEEADDFKDNDKVGELKNGMAGDLETQKGAAQAPMQEAATTAADASGIEPKPVTALEKPEAGPMPADIHAEKAAPKSKQKKDVEQPVKENTQKIGEQMAQAEVTDEQLAKSNEPEFLKGLEGKKEAESQAVTAPEDYRQYESGNINTAQQEATVSATSSLAGMHDSRAGMTEQLDTKQEKTKSDDELARAKVASDIQLIYDETKTSVETILGKLDEQVSTAFDEGAEAAKAVFEDYVDARMTAYKEKRYGGWFGWARWIKDKVAGMPDEVNEFYATGRNSYLKEMDAVVDRVVAIIGAALTEAKLKVAKGKSRISEYVASLPKNLQKVGQEAASDIEEKFDSLEQSIDDKQDQLINDLATKYNENLKAIDARIEELKAANRGLVDMVVGLVVGIIKAILKIKKMLFTLLAKIASVIGDIITDPIGFLGKLIKGIRMGFDKFVANIMKHLIGGLVKWLTGALGPMNITIPEDIFSLKGIFSLVLQVLGLTWDYFRTKAVKLLGEPVVKVLETGFEIFMIVKTKGLAGLWEYIKEQFSNLKEMVIEEIKSLIITQVITAGVKWIIGLLNPAGAFIKAAMAIYEIVKFFIERAAQIYEFVNSVVDSIADIAKGNLSGAAQRVETALANSIPLIIGFLASLLGISGLAKKVQKVIGRVRKKIDKAIDKILLKAKKFARKLYGKGKAAVGKVVEWWKKKKLFKTRKGESHQVYFKGDAKNPIAMVASDNPEPVTSKVARFVKTAQSADATDKQKAMLARLSETSKLAKDNPNSDKIVSNIKEFFDVFAEGRGLDGRATEVNRVTGALGGSVVGTKMTAEWLGPDHKRGGPPETGAQKALMGRLHTDPETPNKSKFIRGHLLNDNLGGEGKDYNLFPITANANKEHLSKIESQVKTWVNREKRWVFYQVEVKNVESSFASATDVRKNYVNATFACRAAIKNTEGKEFNGISASIVSTYNKVETADATPTTGEGGPNAPKVSQEADKMEVLESSSKKQGIYLDDLAARGDISAFTALKFSPEEAQEIIDERPKESGYKRRSQLPSGLTWAKNFYVHRREPAGDK
jgi:hypothetical protein